MPASQFNDYTNFLNVIRITNLEQQLTGRGLKKAIFKRSDFLFTDMSTRKEVSDLNFDQCSKIFSDLVHYGINVVNIGFRLVDLLPKTGKQSKNQVAATKVDEEAESETQAVPEETSAVTLQSAVRLLDAISNTEG